MDVGAGIDGDDADRALLLELQDLLRERKALGDDDLAAERSGGQRWVLVLVEQRADRAWNMRPARGIAPVTPGAAVAA